MVNVGNVGVLTEKQKTWLQNYLPPGGRWNATGAARRAGYAWPNKAGPRVRHSPRIQPLIDAWFLKTYGPDCAYFRYK